MAGRRRTDRVAFAAMRSSFRVGLFVMASALALGCGTKRHAERPRSAERTTSSVPRPPSDVDLYPADEALRDALSGPLTHVGTGPWPGTNRTQACVFRNERVLVVNVYCTRKDSPAFRVDVYSPQRGRLRVYAEARGPVSAHMRQQYFTFVAESEPVPGPQASLPRVALTMSFDELRAYDERRNDAFLPACYGGIEHAQKRGGCLGPLAPRAHAWEARNRPFLERANDDWYSLVRALRRLSEQHGRDPL